MHSNLGCLLARHHEKNELIASGGLEAGMNAKSFLGDLTIDMPTCSIVLTMSSIEINNAFHEHEA